MNGKFHCWIILISFIFCGMTLQAQDVEKYWVEFTDKKGVAFNPLEYFHPKALERRQRNGLPLCDSSDFPVKPEYLEKLTEVGGEIKMTSRWFNSACCFLTEDQREIANSWPFVKFITVMEEDPGSKILSAGEEGSSFSAVEDRALLNQVESLGGAEFTERNLNGDGVRIAIFDAGFKNAQKRIPLSHLFENGQIEKTRDFIIEQDDVFYHSTHGTDVLTCLAGKTDSHIFGLAHGSTFLLARTEYNLREPYSEEENWLAAAEWADRNGVDIINSSLGYGAKRYFESDLDGKTSLVSRAANTAFEKGILVVNAAGNEGVGRWEYLVSPADAEGVLAVGGIDPDSGVQAYFSSFGPTADGRMKPNVSALSTVVLEQPNAGNESTAYGTSFSAPLVAGFAACVIQKFSGWPVEKLFGEIEKSGNLYPYFDYAHGFGMPQAAYFFTAQAPPQKESDWLMIDGDQLTFDFSDLPQRISLGSKLNDKLFFHFADREGKIIEFFVFDTEGSEEMTVEIAENACLVSSWYGGNFTEKSIPCTE